MKWCIVFVLVLSCLSFGAYIADDTQDVFSAGWGTSTSADIAEGAGSTYCDTGHPFLTAGTLSRLRTRFNTAAGGAATSVKIKILRGSSPFTKVGEIDITDEVNAQRGAGGSFVYDSDTHGPDLSTSSLSVQAGDFLSLYTDANINFLIDDTGVDGLVTGAGDTETLSDRAGTYSITFDAAVETAERIIQDADTGYGNGDTIQLPFFATQPQYITIEDVYLPDTEDIQIALKYTNASSASITSLTINLSFDGAGGDDNLIALFGGDSFSATNSFTIAGQEGDHFDIHIWNDPTDGECKCDFVNVRTGQGRKGDAGDNGDIKHISLPINGAGRTGTTYTASTTYPIHRVVITNAGTNATVGSVISHRQPVVMMSDSQGSTKANASSNIALQNVGASLGAAFTEERYVINCGIIGNMVAETSSAKVRMIERWDTFETNYDICGFRNVVVVLLCGPGINDLANINGQPATGAGTTEAAKQALWRVANVSGSLAKMAGDAYAGTLEFGYENDIVMCTLPPYSVAGNHLAKTQEALRDLNQQIKAIAYQSSFPMGDLSNFDMTTYSSDGLHIDQAGGPAAAAGIIAAAYENAAVPANPYGSGGSGAAYSGTPYSGN